MRFTKQQLKQIIKEELNRLHEIDEPLSSRYLPRSQRLRDIGASTRGKGPYVGAKTRDTGDFGPEGWRKIRQSEMGPGVATPIRDPEADLRAAQELITGMEADEIAILIDLAEKELAKRGYEGYGDI